jgi:glutamate-1-semialdehyde 2,1-aminomutase
MSAGIQTLKKLDRHNCYDILRTKKDRLFDLLKPAMEKYRGKILFTQLESIFAFNFTADSSMDSLAQVKSCDMKAFSSFHGNMLERGIYLAPSGFEVGFLSTEHTDTDLATTAGAIMESLQAMYPQ